MLIWLSIGMLFTLAAVLFVLLRWGRLQIQGVSPVSTPVFIAILFTSGLDVGLIMFPLTEFPVYANLIENPEYAFTNPLAIEFGFWGFLIWAMYFLTCFYFCVLESRIGFFKILWVRWLNTLIIVGTCAFTAHLLFANLSWYLPSLASEGSVNFIYAAIVAVTITAAVYSSTDIRYVKILSVSSGVLFFVLLIGLALYALTFEGVEASDFLGTIPLFGSYFIHLQEFVLPINDYHAFYLFWWFAWSIMIGQFTARFVGSMPTWKLFLSMLIWPSISIAAWFAVLYVYHEQQLATQGWVNTAMVVIGVVFVLNSLDSLVRLYSDNLLLTTNRLGKKAYILCHVSILTVLTLLFSIEFIRIQWVGALVIGLLMTCFAYMMLFKREQLASF